MAYCLGVKENTDENFRSSYVLWQEKVLPLFTLEIVSKTPGGERTEKMDIYESMGILYYLVYAPLLKRKTRFQLHNAEGVRYLTPTERLAAERQLVEAERQRAEIAEQDNKTLRQRLRQLGIDPDFL